MTSQKHSIINRFSSLSGFRRPEQQRHHQKFDVQAKSTRTGWWLAICILFLWLLLGYSLQPAHAQTTIPGMTITGETTWDLSGSPYTITGDVTIRNGGELTVKPGVEVRFEAGTGMFVGGGYWNDYGTLIAQGTSTEPIRFTSNSPTPATGDWKGLYFNNGTVDADTVLEQCVVEYGGNYYGSNVYLSHASPTIQNSTISHSSSAGIRVDGNGSSGAIRGNTVENNVNGIVVTNSATPTIDSNNVIRANSTDGLYVDGGAAPTIEANTISGNSRHGISVSGATPTITNNTISGNSGDGIYGGYSNSLAQIAGNTLSNNAGCAIHLSANGVKNLDENSGSGNGEDVIKIYGGDVTSSGTWKKLNDGAFPYVISGDMTIRSGGKVHMC